MDLTDEELKETQSRNKKESNLKIIDFEKKGNVVRFYLGDENDQDYWGDDWDDKPYDCNAGTVYDQYIKGHVDISFPFDDLVFEPADQWNDNVNVSKEDMKNRKIPCIIDVPGELVKDSYGGDTFTDWVGAKGIKKYYFGDKLD